RPARWRRCGACASVARSDGRRPGCAARACSMTPGSRSCRARSTATWPRLSRSPMRPPTRMRSRRWRMSAEATTRLFYREAVARAVGEAMEADDKVILLGQDVGAFGGSYKEFQGLYARFGAAAAGYRPLVSITYMDFLMLGLDALVNYAAKVRYKTAGQLTAPVVIKT